MIVLTALSLVALGQVVSFGDHLAIAQAAVKSRTIVIGRTTEPWYGIGSGGYALGATSFNPSVGLKGTMRQGEYKSVGACGPGGVTFPRVGEESICFIAGDRGRDELVKIMPSTRENIEAVKRALDDKAR